MNTPQYAHAMDVDRDARIEEYKIEILWAVRHPEHAISAKCIELYKQKLTAEIGEQAMSEWLRSVNLAEERKGQPYDAMTNGCAHTLLNYIPSRGETVCQECNKVMPQEITDDFLAS